MDLPLIANYLNNRQVYNNSGKTMSNRLSVHGQQTSLNNAVFHIPTSVSVREWSDKVQMTDVGELEFSSRCLGFVVDSRHTLNGHLLLPGLSR